MFTRNSILGLLCIVALPVFADTQIATCPVGGANATGYGAPALTARARVSNSADGAGPYCKELSAMSTTAYVLTTTDEGKTTEWDQIKTVLAAAAITPPATPTYLANAELTWTAPTTDTLGRALPAGTALTYNVYRGTSATALTKLTSVATTAYLDPATNATPITFYYAVTATCPTCTESGKSGTVSATVASGVIKSGPPGNVALKCVNTPIVTPAPK